MYNDLRVCSKPQCFYARTYVVSSVRSENLLYSLILQMLIIPARALAIFNLYQQGCVRVVSDRVLPAQAELFTQKI